MEFIKTFFRWLGNILLVIIIACAVLSVVSFIKSRKNPNTVPGIGSFKFMAVLSGSMNPTFNVYDLIVDKVTSTEKIKKGDVITFWAGDTLVTHRVVGIEENEDKRVYKTKGDANNVEDEASVDPSKVEGIYLFRIPYGGLVLSKLRGPVGFVIVWILLLYAILPEFFRKKKLKLAAKEAEKAKSTDMNESINN